MANIKAIQRAVALFPVELECLDRTVHQVSPQCGIFHQQRITENDFPIVPGLIQGIMHQFRQSGPAQCRS